MTCAVLCLSIVGLSALAGCNEPPPSAQTIAERHRFETGCSGRGRPWLRAEHALLRPQRRAL